MTLELLYKDETKTTVLIKEIWQDIHSGMDQLYYEHLIDEDGKGAFIPIENLSCWRIKLSS